MEKQSLVTESIDEIIEKERSENIFEQIDELELLTNERPDIIVELEVRNITNLRSNKNFLGFFKF